MKPPLLPPMSPVRLVFNPKGFASRLGEQAATQPERGVHAASTPGLNGVFVLYSKLPTFCMVKRRERRAPHAAQLHGLSLEKDITE